MYFRLMGKLNARRNGLLAEDEKGFTLIELLVVVIIIGILAAIAIPVYLGVQKNAKDSAVKTDVTNLKTAVISAQTDLSDLPVGTSWTPSTLTSKPSLSATEQSDKSWKDYGATVSAYTDTDNFTYAPDATNIGQFCIIAKSKADNKVFYATDSKGVTELTGGGTTCP